MNFSATGSYEKKCPECGGDSFGMTVENHIIDVTVFNSSERGYVAPFSTLTLTCGRCGYQMVANRANPIGPEPELYKPTLPPEGGKVVEVSKHGFAETPRDPDEDEPDHPDEWW